MDTAIVGLQWGDEGKGKVVDYFLSHANHSHCIRFNGGNNAGHTVEKDGKTYKLSLIPTGILTPNILNVISRGVVVDPVHFLHEIKILKDAGIAVSPSNLIIDAGCALITPDHRRVDSEKNSAIGTTGRGIGPAYEDFYARRSLRVGDLALPDHVLEEKFKNFFTNYSQWLMDFRSTILPYVIFDSAKYYQDIDGKVLFEGAQGMMLDVFHGSYPYVTSSSTNPAFASVITGRHNITNIVGVTKAYSTRVGNGPFPTELHTGPEAEVLSTIGREVGTVTGRKRRVGWLDLAQVKRSCEISGCRSIVVTKLDVLDSLGEISVGIGPLANEWVQTDNHMQYKTFAGWQVNTRDVTSWEQLPNQAKQYLEFIEDFLNISVKFISTGPDSSSMISV